MADISVFSPSIDEKRWLSQSIRTITSKHSIETDSIIPTIFQVPKPTKETKPESFTPHLLGLGPYHHLRPELYNAHWQKLVQVQKILIYKDISPRDFFDKKRDNLEPIVRANYDKYLDLEGSSLEYIITIDSMYLLNVLASYDEKTEAENLEPGWLELAKDVIMLENQIPTFALEKMGKDLNLFSPVRGTYEHTEDDEEDLLSPVGGIYEHNTKEEDLEIGLEKDVFSPVGGMYEQYSEDEEDLETGEKEDLYSPVKGIYEQNIEEEEDLEMGKEEYRDGTTFSEVMLYSTLFYNFCKVHSPLKLVAKIHYSESQHLLAQMYHMIVNNDTERFYYPYLRGGGGRSRSRWYSEIGECLTILRELGLGGAIISPLLFAFKSLQVLVNSKLAEELIKYEEQNSKKIQKIEIPSASELVKKHHVEFHPIWHGGIRNIKLSTHPVLTQDIYLPIITLRCDSEVVLRNLVAYEAAVKSTFELAEYVDLMCGIVHTHKDVALLRKRRIVNGDLNDEQVAEIFNGIIRSVGKSREETTSQKVAKQVKEMVEEWEDRKWYKRQYKFLKKIVKNAVKFIRKSFGITMKYLMYIFLVLMLVLQILQAYCQVYGCNTGESETKAFGLLMSA